MFAPASYFLFYFVKEKLSWFMYIMYTPLSKVMLMMIVVIMIMMMMIVVVMMSLIVLIMMIMKYILLFLPLLFVLVP